jgi:hypothetical protein
MVSFQMPGFARYREQNLCQPEPSGTFARVRGMEEASAHAPGADVHVSLSLAVDAIQTYDATADKRTLCSKFVLCRNVMTPAQERAYLAQTTAAERTASLRESGLARRFQALAARDQEAMREKIRCQPTSSATRIPSLSMAREHMRLMCAPWTTQGRRGPLWRDKPVLVRSRASPRRHP